MAPLSGQVALVTGSTRGIGRGTASVLAEQGATVYVTGRTAQPGTDPDLPGSIAETVEAILAQGGTAIGVPLDLKDDDAIAALFAQIAAEQGRIDILVNNAMAIPESMTAPVGFWDKPLANWDIVDTGLRAAYLCAWHAARMMVPARSGLIVGMSGYVGVTYTYDVLFGTTKGATDRMMRDMGLELKPHGVAAISLWQGFTLTERATRNLASVPGMASQLNSAAGSSPFFAGRVIAALAADQDRMARSGGSWIAAELAEDYGVTDIDGRTIPSLRDQRGSPLWGPV